MANNIEMENNIVTEAKRLVSLGYSKAECLHRLLEFNSKQETLCEGKKVEEILDNEFKNKNPKEDTRESKKMVLITADALMDSDIPEPEWLWDGLLPVNGCSLIVSKPKVGKSVMCINLAVHVSQGWTFLGRSTKRGNVLYVALEENQRDVKHYLSVLKGYNEGLPNIHWFFGTAPKDALEQIAGFIRELDLKLVIIDIFQKFFRPKETDNYAEITNLLEPVTTLARESNCHISLTHHSRKGLETDIGETVLGSTGFLGAVDVLLHLRKDGEKRGYRVLNSVQRSGYGTDFENAILAIAEDDKINLELQGDLVEKLRLQVEGEIFTLLKDDAGRDISMSQNDIVCQLSHTKQLVIRCLNRLYEQGRVFRIGKGVKGDPRIYAVSAGVFHRESGEGEKA